MVRQQGESGVYCGGSGVVQPQGIQQDSIHILQAEQFPRAIKTGSGRVLERTRSEEADGKSGLGWLPSPALRCEYLSCSGDGEETG